MRTHENLCRSETRVRNSTSKVFRLRSKTVVMKWGSIRDGVVEGKSEDAKCWIRLARDGRVTGIYVKLVEVSKFVPADPSEETLDGAKLRAEIEIERYNKAIEIAKLNKKGEYKI